MISEVKLVDRSTVYKKGTQALIDELGVCGMLRYLEQYDNGGSGDYTKEKYNRVEPEIDEIVNM